MGFTTRPLGPETWTDFERLAEKHRGVWGGCWCIAFHPKPRGLSRTVAQNREVKERLVRTGRAHAALVYDGTEIVGWCQFGSPTELPARMTSYARTGQAPPDWRITCFFVDRDRRREGVSKAGLAGALCLIAAEGGGTVEAYPVDTGGKSTSGSFIWGGTSSMFEGAGFRVVTALGPNKRMMRAHVRARGHLVRGAPALD